MIGLDEIKKYREIVDEFKLFGRYRKSIDVYKILKAYINGYYNGNFLDIVEVQALRDYVKYIDYEKLMNSNYWDKVNNCDNNCQQCDYCSKLLKFVSI